MTKLQTRDDKGQFRSIDAPQGSVIGFRLEHTSDQQLRAEAERRNIKPSALSKIIIEDWIKNNLKNP